MEIYSLKVKFKDMQERKASSHVEEGDEPQSDAGDQFRGRNQKKAKGGY